MPPKYRQNVRHHGAKGDGSTDDTAAIQRAIDHVPDGGGEVFFPAGAYLITAPLYLSKSGTALRGIPVNPFGSAIWGNHPTGSRIVAGATVESAMIDGFSMPQSQSPRGWIIENLELDAAGKFTWGITFKGGLFHLIHNVHILGAEYGIFFFCADSYPNGEFTSMQNVRVQDVLIEPGERTQLDAGGIVLSANLGETPTGDICFCTFDNVKIVHTGASHGIVLYGSDSNSFREISIARWNGTGFGVYMHDNVEQGGENSFWGLTAGMGGYYQDKIGANPVHLYTYRQGNGEPDPIVLAGTIKRLP